MNRVLISGGSRGIGAAIVRAFARQGDAVAFLYRENHAAAEAIARETGAIAIPCDISDSTAVREATKAAIKALGGPIDVLVNNAGMAKIGLSRDMTDAEWRQI